MSTLEQQPHGKSGFSRRAFLKGSGAAAAATALAGGTGLVAQEPKGPAVQTGETEIELNVNGMPHKVKVENRTTLLEVLRFKLNLTGAKPISVDGSSGGSTVIIDDKPASATNTLAKECVGKKILTSEGLGGAKLDPVCKEFAENDASQCGFCTPGFVVAVRAFLNKNPKATEDEIRKGLDGNLCRCGTYANIVPACIAVVKGAGNG